MCVYIYIYTYVCIYIYIYIYTCMYTYNNITNTNMSTTNPMDSCISSILFKMNHYLPILVATATYHLIMIVLQYIMLSYSICVLDYSILQYICTDCYLLQ